ncbi:charged multivesicular body protein 3 [Cordyceps militaris CM01]|uniref:Charged multivesicular body protein 3 n=2 Tax=Cordyceps militaris TaxID=73501 RepID=G3JRF0_CORMM|nr:charged multivesicular body protein 3 [Cordyceps militaris CM01]ATY65384.1 charged multivesicular body 3 [Cordyceps militaris]EGX88500.1 charged multivesicular body protein 3 [Cordyceps militaris CM01]
MEALRAVFTKPDPQAQARKCNALLRTNIRKLDRDVNTIKQAEAKARQLILQADKRGQRDPSRAAQAKKEVRMYAGEVVRARRQTARLYTAKAQLSSVQMQVSEAFAVRKIEGSIKASVGIMKDVNKLISLPALAGTMRELGTELMKAGIIEEMVEDVLPEDNDLLLDDEAEAEVDKVLSQILKEKKETTPAAQLPAAPLPDPEVPVEVEEEEDPEEMMDQMRDRLNALRS